jgi:hypothetical protein
MFGFGFMNGEWEPAEWAEEGGVWRQEDTDLSWMNYELLEPFEDEGEDSEREAWRLAGLEEMGEEEGDFSCGAAE